MKHHSRFTQCQIAWDVYMTEQSEWSAGCHAILLTLSRRVMLLAGWRDLHIRSYLPSTRGKNNHNTKKIIWSSM